MTQDLAVPPFATHPPRVTRRVTIRACRPSLVDLRFKGDPWVVRHDADATVCLGDFAMSQVRALALDVPSLNRALMQVRLGQARRNQTLRRK